MVKNVYIVYGISKCMNVLPIQHLGGYFKVKTTIENKIRSIHVLSGEFFEGHFIVMYMV